MNYPKSKKRILKDENPNAVGWTLGVAIALLFVGYLGCGLMACQKESSFTAPKGVIESDHHLKPAGGYNLTKRDVTPELQMASKKANPGKGKGKPGGGTDTTGGGGSTDPQPATGNVLYIDTDGEYITGTYWNVNGPINAAYSGMNATELDTLYARFKRQYEPMGFTVTMDRSVYDNAPAGHRQMVIVTESWEWYGQAGGVAYVGSYKWAESTPCFVFSSLLGYSGKYVSDAGIHEAGHALGLRHIPEPDGSSAYCTYGNWMGAAYYVPWGFFEYNAKDQYGNTIDQFSVINSNL